MTNVMEKFLMENEEQFLSLPANMFTAVGKDDCPIGSKCEGYELGGTYKLGESQTKTVTTSKGEPLLVVDFELGLKEANPDYRYELSFGFENNGTTESVSFYRKPDDSINFMSAYEKGGLTETRTNKSKAFRDFGTWTGQAQFDAEGKKFSATAMRAFSHVIKERELKLGASHKWGTVFSVKNKDGKKIAVGVSKEMTMTLNAENGFSGA